MTAPLNKIVTQMEVHAGGWKLMMNRVGTPATRALWSGIRYPADKPMIPPYGEILTVNGWEPVLRENRGAMLSVTESRFAGIVEETCS